MMGFKLGFRRERPQGELALAPRPPAAVGAEELEPAVAAALQDPAPAGRPDAVVVGRDTAPPAGRVVADLRVFEQVEDSDGDDRLPGRARRRGACAHGR